LASRPSRTDGSSGSSCSALSGAEAETGGAEFDIYIGEKDCWGKGYGTEATRLICRYGFNKMRLHRILLWVADANTAAIRVYEKVGFVEEGRARDTIRHEGKWHDMILMCLLPRTEELTLSPPARTSSSAAYASSRPSATRASSVSKPCMP
jgi:hypothetical protein